MKKSFVISNTPVRLPINGTVLYTFLMWFFQAKDFYWGIYIVFLLILWTACIISINRQQRVDLFADEKDPEQKMPLSKFQRKMEEIQKQRRNEA